ncbi:hypothetical protein HRbin36_02298 [bacterium HR36]|nr:hypothetical protein HRbin36_02298 [bacterium HR36]
MHLSNQTAACHGHDHMLRQSPTELLCDFVSQRLGTFRIKRPQVDIDQAPAIFEGNLCTQAVDLVVSPLNTNQTCAINRGADDLGLLNLCWDENVGNHARSRGVGGNAVG